MPDASLAFQARPNFDGVGGFANAAARADWDSFRHSIGYKQRRHIRSDGSSPPKRNFQSLNKHRKRWQLFRETDFAYDGNGNLTSVTRLAHTGNALTASFTYDPIFNQLTSITDPLSHTTTFSYDASGALSSISDPLGHKTNFGVNSVGQITNVTDALGNTTQFTYAGGDLTAITDPLMSTTNRFLDGAGRLIEVTNALGRITRYAYNPLNEITQITDPLHGVTSFIYDENGNLRTVQDANQNQTTYTYNNDDLVATRTDPLQRTESYTYDADQNLVSFTDRKGQVTTYQYDNLNRPNFVGFGTQGNTYASTISYQYDGGNRMTQATDSISGQITRGYDGLDRLTSETTPQGSISYIYDNANRRATMQVAGQAQVSYTFDNANRLTQIAQGTSTVGFSYDNANRRSALTLPSGIVATYSYDNDSHLTGIAYTLNSASVGALNYGYDALGMRTSVSGSMARTGLPQPVPSASYDAANELLAWNETTLSYDANGNMLSDGINAFTWNERNQLATLDGSSSQYDAVGRRNKNLAGKQFVYDGIDPIQELTSGAPTANSISGGIDEFFARTDSSGTYTPLLDGLGSTLALANATGAIQSSYTYDPFGATTQSGTATSNAFQYTGRENEGNGLYFYRARYYNPQLGRFISEDPIGLAGGMNRYAYAYDSPTEFTDPLGLWGLQIGNVNLGQGDPTLLFNNDSWGYFGQSLAAAADGVVPFFKPFHNFYNECDSNLRLGRSLATASRDVALAALIPNLSLWAQNPALYEIGSLTVPSEVYEGMEGLNAIQKGSYLLSNYGATGIPGLMWQALRAGEFANTVWPAWTGLTPGGYLLGLGMGQAADSYLKGRNCGCK